MTAVTFMAPVLLQPVIVITNMTLQVLGRSLQATFISSCRQGIFFLPLILLLPLFWGITGVQLTQPLADVLTLICCVPLLWLFFRDLKRDEQAAASKHNKEASL